MPVLAGSVLVAVRLRRPARPAAVALLVAGILASWAGDSLLTFDGGVMFVVGLGAFLLAHVAYIAAFVVLGRGARARRLPPWTLLYPIAVVGLAISLWTGLGSLVGPVLVYAGVLATMAAMSARLTPVLAAGGALFLVSDSLLALDRFGDGWYAFALNGLVVMLTYTAAQGLIAIGVVQAAANDASARPSAAPGRRGSATVR
nr:lysoplasmalogenase [Agromyces seonyuensis]